MKNKIDKSKLKITGATGSLLGFAKALDSLNVFSKISSIANVVFITVAATFSVNVVSSSAEPTLASTQNKSDQILSGIIHETKKDTRILPTTTTTTIPSTTTTTAPIVIPTTTSTTTPPIVDKINNSLVGYNAFQGVGQNSKIFIFLEDKYSNGTSGWIQVKNGVESSIPNTSITKYGNLLLIKLDGTLIKQNYFLQLKNVNSDSTTNKIVISSVSQKNGTFLSTNSITQNGDTKISFSIPTNIPNFKISVLKGNNIIYLNDGLSNSITIKNTICNNDCSILFLGRYDTTSPYKPFYNSLV